MSEKSTRPWIRRSCLIIYVLVIFTSAFEMMGTFSDVHWAPADRVIADLRLDALARPSRVVYPTRRNVGSEFEVCAHDRARTRRKKFGLSGHRVSPPYASKHRNKIHLGSVFAVARLVQARFRIVEVIWLCARPIAARESPSWIGRKILRIWKR